MQKFITITLVASVGLFAVPAFANLFSLPEALTLETQQQSVEKALAAYKAEVKSGNKDAPKKVLEAEGALKALKKEKKKVYKNVKTQGLCKMEAKDLDLALQRSSDANVANLKTMQPKADDKKLKEQAAESVRRFKIEKAELCPET